jgi:hypothetical protein
MTTFIRLAVIAIVILTGTAIVTNVTEALQQMAGRPATLAIAAR